MTAPNTSYNRSVQYLGDSNPDGTKMFSSPRSKPVQAAVQAAGLGSIAGYNANGGALSAVGANTCGGQAITATGIAATDFIVGVTKPTAQAGLGHGYSFVPAANAANVNFCNPTAGSITPTANQSYCVTALRGFPVISANGGTISAVTYKTTREDTFTLAPTGASATSNISGGVVTTISVANGGSYYYVPPKVVISPTANSDGAGASAVAIVANGAVIGVRVTDGGSNYTSAPTVTFEGGSYVTPGMMAMVEKAAHQANLVVCGCRVAGENKVAVTYAVTGAANVTPTANETYRFVAFNDMAAVSPLLNITANLANCIAAAANTSNATAVTAAGISTTDVVLQTQTALQTPLVFGGAQATANTITFAYGGGVPGGTPANGVYTFPVLKQDVGYPVKVFSVTLTPASVAAITTAEQIFTLPSNVTLQANSTVIVNKSTHTSGIGVVGARANSTSTLGITYMNVTTGAIVPPAETYLIANFPSYAPTISANQIEGCCTQIIQPTFNSLLDQGNEFQQSLVEAGIIAGK